MKILSVLLLVYNLFVIFLLAKIRGDRLKQIPRHPGPKFLTKEKWLWLKDDGTEMQTSVTSKKWGG